MIDRESGEDLCEESGLDDEASCTACGKCCEWDGSRCTYNLTTRRPRRSSSARWGRAAREPLLWPTDRHISPPPSPARVKRRLVKIHTGLTDSTIDLHAWSHGVGFASALRAASYARSRARRLFSRRSLPEPLRLHLGLLYRFRAANYRSLQPCGSRTHSSSRLPPASQVLLPPAVARSQIARNVLARKPTAEPRTKQCHCKHWHSCSAASVPS